MARAGFLAAAVAVAALVGVAAQTPTQGCVQNGDTMAVVVGTTTYSRVGGFIAGTNSIGTQIVDSRSASIDGYRYYVSVCSDIQTPPSVGNDQNNLVTCTNTCNSGAPAPCVPQAYAPAYQVCYTGATCNTNCFRLGDTYRNALYTPPMSGNPAHGFHVLYTNGDNCTASGPPRASSLMFVCQDSNGLSPNQNLVVESTNCIYNMMIFGPAGCPATCPFGGSPHYLCGGRGVCDYDTSAGAARCFCDQGYSLNAAGYCVAGNGPAAPPTPSYGSNIAGGFFGGAFLGAALFLGYVAFLARGNFGSFKEKFSTVFTSSGASSSSAAGGGYAPAPAAPIFGGSADSAYAPPAGSGADGALLA